MYVAFHLGEISAPLTKLTASSPVLLGFGLTWMWLKDTASWGEVSALLIRLSRHLSSLVQLITYHAPCAYTACLLHLPPLLCLHPTGCGTQIS